MENLSPVTTFIDFDQHPTNTKVLTEASNEEEEPWSTVAQKLAKIRLQEEQDKVTTKTEDDVDTSNKFAMFTETLEEDENQVNEYQTPKQVDIHISPVSSNAEQMNMMPSSSDILYDKSTPNNSTNDLQCFSNAHKNCEKNCLMQEEIDQVYAIVLSTKMNSQIKNWCISEFFHQH